MDKTAETAAMVPMGMTVLMDGTVWMAHPDGMVSMGAMVVTVRTERMVWTELMDATDWTVKTE
jgi:hypothetical protein